MREFFSFLFALFRLFKITTSQLRTELSSCTRTWNELQRPFKITLNISVIHYTFQTLSKVGFLGNKLCSANLWLSNTGVSKQWHLSRLVVEACFGGDAFSCSAVLKYPTKKYRNVRDAIRSRFTLCYNCCGNSQANFICYVKHILKARVRVSHRGSPCHFSRFVIYQFFFLLQIVQFFVSNWPILSKMFNSTQNVKIVLSCPKCQNCPILSKLFSPVNIVQFYPNCPNCPILSYQYETSNSDFYPKFPLSKLLALTYWRFQSCFYSYILGISWNGEEENVLSKIGVATLAFIKIWRPVEKAISTKYEEAKRSNSEPYCRHLYLLAHWSGYLWRHWVRRRKEAQRSIRK